MIAPQDDKVHGGLRWAGLRTVCPVVLMGWKADVKVGRHGGAGGRVVGRGHDGTKHEPQAASELGR